jgi:DNA-binding response OmpR family regulator
MKLLVIEDSERLRRALKEGLRRFGYAVDTAADGPEGLGFAEVNEYDVIVLDLMLPGIDGLSLLKALRRAGNHTEVLILSAKDQVEDRVRGLNLGADDYLVKPFVFDELVARIQALVRRRHNITEPGIMVGELRVDTARRQAMYHEEPIPLTPHEYRLLEYLALRRGHVISKAQLHYRLYDSDIDTELDTIEVVVSNLRRKLREAGSGDVVRTQRGFGYFVD